MPRNLRLKKHFSIIPHSPDIVELRYGVWNPVSHTLADERESGLLFKILSQLDGSASLADIAKREGVAEEEVQSLVDQLFQLGAVESTSSNALDYYLETTIPTLARLDGKNFADTPVVLFGDSALTSEIHRLLKQTLPGIDVSVPVADDAALQILSNNDTSWLMNGVEFQRRLRTFESLRQRMVVVAMKIINPIFLRILNRVCLEYRTAWIHAALDGPFLFVGPVFIPHRTACYECFETRVMMNLREAASYQRYKLALIEGKLKVGSMPIEPVLLSLLASLTSFEVLNYLLTQTTFTVGKVLSVYLPTLEFSFNEVLRVVNCTACASTPGSDERELYFDARAFLHQ